MACIPPSRLRHHLPDANPSKLISNSPRFLSPSSLPPLSRSLAAASRPSDSLLCRCRNPSPADGDSGSRGWESVLQDAVRSAVKRWDDYVSSYWNPSPKALNDSVSGGEKQEQMEMWIRENDEWDWERWKRHFADVEEEELILAVLKSQLRDAVAREDYQDAAKLKLAINATSDNDAVGIAIADLNRAIAEELYRDATFIRDHAGAGLLGWWAGISEDAADPYGRIVHISAEHGRYVARSYNSRQLATGSMGVPLFEIFFTENGGEYKEQAVYLKWNIRNSRDLPKKSLKKSDSSSGSLSPSDTSSEGPNDNYRGDIKVIEERDDDSDITDDVAGIQNILRDMIPGVKVKVLKVMTPGKVDRDLIAKVIEQIMDEEEEGDAEVTENVETEDGGTESDSEEINIDAADAANRTNPEPNEVPMKFVIGTLMQKLSSNAGPREKVRVPARIKRSDFMSFLFSIEHDDGLHETDEKNSLQSKITSRSAQQSADLVMSDLAKVFLSTEKIPMKGQSPSIWLLLRSFDPGFGRGKMLAMPSPPVASTQRGLYMSSSTLPAVWKAIANVITLAKDEAEDRRLSFLNSCHWVLRDVGQLISSAINQNQNQQTLSGTTLFNRITIPTTSDPLSGLYVGAHGMYTSEILHLKRKFGQWQADDLGQKHTDLEFYEYVEAWKLTGSHNVPAGQTAFRAKVGKHYQLPHKGIIPEEFGVIARYKGQGRLADPGFQNPRWVDGELVILDGKYVRGGPVIGFVYWAPEYHFLIFFNRLKLPE